MESLKSANILENFEILFQTITGLPLEYVLDNYNFILRTGTRNFRDGKPDIYRNFYYHAPNGRKDVQDYYKEKDLKNRKEAQAKAEASAREKGMSQPKFNPIENNNHIKGQEQLTEWLKNGVADKLSLYIAPHSIDAGITEEEVNKFGGKCRVIRLENDDTVEFEKKLEYFTRLGLPTESLLLHSGSKSPHHIFTFGNGETLPELDWEQVAELEAQMLRRSGFDGYEATIRTLISRSKTMMLRIPGSFHQKSKKQTTILRCGDWWDIKELEGFVYGKFPKLGTYKAQKKAESEDTYPTGVQDFDKVILSSSWFKRFNSYESYADEQARIEKQKQKIENERKKRYEQAQTSTPEELERRKSLAIGDEWSILDIIANSVRLEVESGTPDGQGRSHLAASRVAQALLEGEDALTQFGLKFTLTAEDLFMQWANKTFTSSEKYAILKVQKTFKIYKSKHKTAPEWLLNKIENILHKKQNSAVAQEILLPYIKGKNLQDLIEEVTRGLKTTDKELSVDTLPLLFKDWQEVKNSLTTTSQVYATKSSDQAVEIVEAGKVCVFITNKTSPNLIHQLAETCAENGYQIAFSAKATEEDKLLAERIRNGYFSEIVKSTNRDKKVKIHKPECVVIEGNCVWGAQYFWQRVSQTITSEMIGNRSNKNSIYLGFAAESQWFSDVLSQCEKQASSKKLLALISEMGTGKTEAAAKTIKGWGQRILAVAHRETLTTQAAKRLGLVYYKDPQYISALDKYLKGQDNGLAVTINTLVQGSTDQGYLPDFKIEDWIDTTLFIDEAESFIKYLVESGTIAENRQKAIEAIRKTAKFVTMNGGRVVLADANLTTKTIKLFEQWIAGEGYSEDTKSADYNAYVILNTYKKLQGRSLISVNTNDEVVSSLYETINQGGKAMYFTDVKAASSRYYFSTQSYGMYLRELGYGHVLDADTKQFTDDVDHNLLERIHPVFQSAFGGCAVSVSPVIDSGTDWNGLGINSVFACYKGIMGIDNTLQQLERVRDNVLRFVCAARRSTIGLGKNDILNLEKRFDEVRNSYKNVEEKLIENWSEYQKLQRQDIEERLKNMFPQIDKPLLDWWRSSLLEGFYGAQEFRINLLARMAEKGYEISEQEVSVDGSLISNVKEFGKIKQEEKYDEIAEGDLALLAEIDKNDDTMPKATSRAKDLKSCLNALSIKDASWTLNFTKEERIELVKRTLGKKSKMRRKLIYGFALRCHFVNEQQEIANILAYADDFRAAIFSTNRSIKDTPASINSAIGFLIEDLKIKDLVTTTYQEAVKRNVGEEGKLRMFFNNRMKCIKDVNKQLLINMEYIRKTFGFKVDPRPSCCARNVSELFKSIGFQSKSERNRSAEYGKNKNGGNELVYNFLITEDTLHFKVWKCWVDQFNKKDCEFLKYFYNPANDEGGDAIWQQQLGINVPEKSSTNVPRQPFIPFKKREKITA